MGKFEVYENKNGIKIKLGESNNRLLYCGRQYALDTVFGIEAWQSGVAGFDGSLPASGVWDPYRTIVIGTCADDNTQWLSENGYLANGGTGISGNCPTGGTTYGHLPNLTDTYMSSAASGSNANYNVGTGLFFKRADKVIRVGRTVSLEATFSATEVGANINATTILSGTQIRELGVTLSDNPTGLIDPVTDRTYRPHTLFCRSVRYTVTGDHIEDNPIEVGANSITVRYTFGDVV